METLARVDVLYFDKTGTITTGNMKVQEMDANVVRETVFLSGLFEDENATSLSARRLT